MKSEKVKEIKESIQQVIRLAEYVDSSYVDCVCLDLLKDALTLIDELESENKRLMQSNKNVIFANDILNERNNKLEEALLDMVVQFCQMGKEGYLDHTFMSAEENAFDVLDIKYGEKVDDVYKRFYEKWGRND